MFFLPRPRKIRRYKDIVSFLIKHASRDFIQGTGLEKDVAASVTSRQTIKGDPVQFVRDLEALGPTFVKLGQIFSTRADLLPQPYIEALSRLQDEVEPFSWDEVESILVNELRRPVSEAFIQFNSQPLAAGSLGQVHRARLHCGTEVAVKVQRPHIRSVILEDLDIISEIAGSVDRHTDIGRKYLFEEMVDEFRKTLLRELDYTLELQNLSTMASILRRYPDVMTPAAFREFSTSHVLTMEFVSGVPIQDHSLVSSGKFPQAHQLAQQLFRSYLDQVLVDGFFHADPHPGNILITEEGKLCLIDLGMVSRITPRSQENLLKLLLAISDGDGHEVAKISMKIATRLPDFDEHNFVRQVSDLVLIYKDATIEQMQTGHVVMELARIANNNSIRPASELTNLGKALLHLDEISRTLDPSFNPAQSLKKHSESVLRRHFFKNFSSGRAFSAMLEGRELMEKFPRRINEFSEALSRNELEFRVRVFDEMRALSSLQGMSNRITMGIVLAALILGAAILTTVPSEHTVFGYPIIAMVVFLIAAAWGFALVISIFLQDRKTRKKGPS
ncbi:ABC1 kinase family protein [Desulfurispira natronophila]|uniref:Putative unusual protein kinase regulating ubiquinone biosynthesis (AarF/ABC1/UbiB family) n=1 Tax=Desulfurispira natronophila TaxID=682562 RepID=A0A7W8DHP5_9BACT|nr:AarF/UbiB family protein [Desulfurispira natronophila]MBB5022503.1 putative unusual protein kinase regulating ubiquinone biosynthesis (AarF/ABC1/UbiB family) [Desulfurispira natronophila]